MNEGRIVEVGPPDQIYGKPKMRFTAQFVGSYNLFPGRMVRRGAGRGVALTTLGELECAAADEVTDEVIVGIRPEQVEIVGKDEGLAEKRNVFQGIVRSDLFLGRLRDCMIQVGSTNVRVQVPASGEALTGKDVYLHFPPKFCITLAANSDQERSETP